VEGVSVAGHKPLTELHSPETDKVIVGKDDSNTAAKYQLAVSSADISSTR